MVDGDYKWHIYVLLNYSLFFDRLVLVCCFAGLLTEVQCQSKRLRKGGKSRGQEEEENTDSRRVSSTSRVLGQVPLLPVNSAHVHSLPTASSPLCHIQDVRKKNLMWVTFAYSVNVALVSFCLYSSTPWMI